VWGADGPAAPLGRIVARMAVALPSLIGAVDAGHSCIRPAGGVPEPACFEPYNPTTSPGC